MIWLDDFTYRTQKNTNKIAHEIKSPILSLRLAVVAVLLLNPLVLYDGVLISP